MGEWLLFHLCFIGSLPFSSHFHYSLHPFPVTSYPFLYKVSFFPRRKALLRLSCLVRLTLKSFFIMYSLCFQTTKSQFMFYILVFNWTFSFWGCLCFVLFFFCSLSPVYPMYFLGVLLLSSFSSGFYLHGPAIVGPLELCCNLVYFSIYR